MLTVWSEAPCYRCVAHGRPTLALTSKAVSIHGVAGRAPAFDG